MKANDKILPVKDMIYFASLYPKDTNMGISVYVEIRDYEIDTTDNIALKATPNRSRNISNACDVIFNRYGEMLEVRPNRYGQVLPDMIYSDLQKWMLLNIELIVLHWDREIDTVDFCRGYKKLPQRQL